MGRMREGRAAEEMAPMTGSEEELVKWFLGAAGSPGVRDRAVLGWGPLRQEGTGTQPCLLPIEGARGLGPRQ